MQAGKLRKSIELQRRSTIQDDYGQPQPVWETVATTNAEFELLSGRELIAAQAVQSEVTHNVTIRYRAGITPAMRISYGGRLFNIHAVLDESERHRMLTLLCSEGLNDG